MSTRVVVIGVGNEFRHDDGVGPAVVDLLRGQCPATVTLAVCDGEASRLIELWDGAHLAIVVDAVRAEPPHPGRVHRLTARPPPDHHEASSHGLGLDDALALAQVLGRLPDRLMIYAVEAADLTTGPGLTPAVAETAQRLATEIAEEASCA